MNDRSIVPGSAILLGVATVLVMALAHQLMGTPVSLTDLYAIAVGGALVAAALLATDSARLERRARHEQRQRDEYTAWCIRNRWCQGHDMAIGQCPPVNTVRWDGRSMTQRVPCDGDLGATRVKPGGGHAALTSPDWR